MSYDLKEQYQWTRLWKLRSDSNTELTHVQRYLQENYSQKDLPPSRRPIRDFHDEKCLVLLGPAGAGKSEAAKQFKAAQENEGTRVFSFDLGTYDDNSEIRGDVKEALYSLDDLRHLVLLLDGLDECPAQAPLRAIGRTLSRIDGDSLTKVQVRVACRSTYWAARPDLEGVLRETWGEVSVADIEPLGQEDVEVALHAEGVDAARFWEDVGRAGAHALTKQPLTLRLLLREYLDQNHQLPSTRTALYNSGCSRLAEEHHSRRRHSSQLSSNQRLEVLRPLAAVMILGQHSALWVGDSHERPDQDLMLDDILGREIHLPSGRVLGRDDLMEAKNTGFLKGTQLSESKAERLAWVERTFAEFLTARFLKENNLTLGQLLDLLAAPNDHERRIAPPMHEVASWLAAWRSDLFDHILRTDPVVLLTGDVASFSGEEKLALTRHLLTAYDLGDLRFINHVMEPGSRQLAAAGIDDLLAPYIASDEYDDHARELAIMLASWNRRTALLPDLTDLALDSNASASLRAEAIHAVGAIAQENDDEESLRKVAPLLEVGDEEDAGYSIRGAVLDAAYPALLSFANVRPHLNLNVKDVDGRYQLFIKRDLIRGVDTAEIPDAFEWLAGQDETGQGGVSSSLHMTFDDLEHALCLRAAKVLTAQTTSDQDKKAVAAALARRLAVRADQYRNLPSSVSWHLSRQEQISFDELWAEEASLRRRVVPVLLQTADEEAFDQLAMWLAGYGGLLQRKDLDWILQKAVSETSAKAKQRWLQLAQHLFSIHDADILRPYLEDGKVREFFAVQVGLGENAAAEDILQAFEKQQEESIARQKRWKRKRAERNTERQQPSAEGLEEILEELQAADSFVPPHCLWQEVISYLTDIKRVRRDITDVREEPAWQEADSDLKKRVLTAAQVFLKTINFDHTECVQAPQVCSGFPMESVAALRLLHAEKADPFGHWDETEWMRWAALVAAYEPTSDEDAEALSALLKLFYEHAPEAVTSAVLARIDVASASGQKTFLPALRKFGPVWDHQLVSALSEKVSDPALSVYTYSEVMNHLLATGLPEPWQRAAQHLAEARFEKEKSDDSEKEGKQDRLQRRALEASARMLEHDPEHAWSVLWPILEASDDFTDRLVKRNSGMLWGRDSKMLAPLSAAQLEELYRKLSRLYPHSEDPERPEGVSYHPTFRDDVARFRGSVLQKLVNDGADAHVARIRDSLPHLEWLAETQRQAEEVAMRTAWRRHEPQEVLRLARDQSVRLARSGMELLEVVTEVLRSLEDDLRGHPPAVYELWNTLPRNRLLKVAAAELGEGLEKESTAVQTIEDLARNQGRNHPCYVPKEETDISDYVARHLQRELPRTVIGREVEVEPGNKPDLRASTYVLGSSPDQEDAVHIVVEVKGSWNGSVYSAMKDQLAGRYLATSDCRHGIFLVAWPYCEKWHDSDWRKAKSRRGGIEKLRRKLSEQANALDHERWVLREVVIDIGLPDR